jgi:hypothetical protein
LEFQVRAIQQEEEIKDRQIGKEEVKLPDFHILYLKDPKIQLLDIISNFSKVADYENNLQKPVACLYINNEQTEKEYRKAIPFTIASKIPRNKLNKGSERPLQLKVLTIEERNPRTLQKRERYPMLMGWQNQYCENGSITNSNLHVQ